jgi:hypothetical protein
MESEVSYLHLAIQGFTHFLLCRLKKEAMKALTVQKYGDYDNRYYGEYQGAY